MEQSEEKNTVTTENTSLNPVEPIVPRFEDSGEAYVPKEAMTRYADLPTMTEQEVMDAICEIAEGGVYSKSNAELALKTVPGYAEMIDENGEPIKEIGDDDYEDIDETEIGNYKLSLTSNDGDHLIMELDFGKEDSIDYELAIDSVNAYQDKLTAYLDGESKDLPLYVISIMPEASIRYVVTFASPIAIFQTLNDDGNVACLSMVFKMDDVTVSEMSFTQEEYNQIKDNIRHAELRKLEQG